MTTEEHLNAIVAFCERNLAIAKKRTPGEWEVICLSEDHPSAFARVVLGENQSLSGYCGNTNAQFIAACAGAAEAGWKATIAAIRGFKTVLRYGNHGTAQDTDRAIAEILAAYPIELITKP